MYDPAMTAPDTEAAAGAAAGPAAGLPTLDWRPQGFGKARAAAIDDPLVEPLWSGVRVLAHVDAGRTALRDLDGDPVDDFPEINSALRGAIRAERVVVDAHLTHQPVQAIAEVPARPRIGRARSAAG